MIVAHEELCGLIPHSGSMCLLDGVREWDEHSICCTTRTHQSDLNPLRKNGQLSAVHTLEYGAQAMAVHGGLLARQKGQTIKGGYLAALRDVELHLDRIDNLEDPLIIQASELMSGNGNLMYVFKITSGDMLVSTGRATVITQD